MPLTRFTAGRYTQFNPVRPRYKHLSQRNGLREALADFTPEFIKEKSKTTFHFISSHAPYFGGLMFCSNQSKMLSAPVRRNFKIVHVEIKRCSRSMSIYPGSMSTNVADLELLALKILLI